LLTRWSGEGTNRLSACRLGQQLRGDEPVGEEGAPRWGTTRPRGASNFSKRIGFAPRRKKNGKQTEGDGPTTTIGCDCPKPGSRGKKDTPSQGRQPCPTGGRTAGMRGSQEKKGKAKFLGLTSEEEQERPRATRRKRIARKRKKNHGGKSRFRIGRQRRGDPKTEGKGRFLNIARNPGGRLLQDSVPLRKAKVSAQPR